MHAWVRQRILINKDDKRQYTVISLAPRTSTGRWLPYPSHMHFSIRGYAAAHPYGNTNGTSPFMQINSLASMLPLLIYWYRSFLVWSCYWDSRWYCWLCEVVVDVVLIYKCLRQSELIKSITIQFKIPKGSLLAFLKYLVCPSMYV